MIVIPNEGNCPTRNLIQILTWSEILQGKAFQNDIAPVGLQRLARDSSFRLRCIQNDSVLLFLSQRKEVIKKGRPLVIGYSCLPHRSSTGLRNSLCSNSPRPLSSFSLAPGSPIKAGMLLHAIGACARSDGVL